MAFPSIRNIDPFPQRDGSQTPAQFSAAVDNVFSSIDGMISDLNAFGVYADDIGEENQGYADAAASSASSASNSALNASRDAAQAAASANYKGNWASLSGSLSKPASVFHAGEYWLLNNNLSNVAASTPSDANADWQKIQTYQAWGLGVSGKIVSDLNTISGSGFYRVSPTGLNKPQEGAPFEVIHVQYDDNSAKQMAFRAGIGVVQYYARAKAGGSWNDWVEMHHSETPHLTVVNTSGDIVRTGAQTEVYVDTGSNISLNLVAGDYNSGDEIIINKPRRVASLTVTSDANIADPSDSSSLTHTLSAGFIAVIRIVKRGPSFRLSIS